MEVHENYSLYACVIIIIFTHYHFNFIFLDCESETPKGQKQSRDVLNGGQADITCSGGCIHFVEVLSMNVPYHTSLWHTLRPCLVVTMIKPESIQIRNRSK